MKSFSIIQSNSFFQPNFNQITTGYGWTGLGIQAGLGIRFKWTILFDLDVLVPTVSTSSLPSLPKQAQPQLDCASCIRQEWNWEGTQVQSLLGIQYKPFDWLSPLITCSVGGQSTSITHGYALWKTDLHQWKGHTIKPQKEWSWSLRILVGGEWRWNDRWGIGGGGSVMSTFDQWEIGGRIWLTYYRYLRWF